MYQLVLKDGAKVGQYSPNSSPAKVAEKIAKVLYESEGMKGKQQFSFNFCKNRTIAEGGDKFYRYHATVMPLPRNAENLVSVGGRNFYKKYKIDVTNLLN